MRTHGSRSGGQCYDEPPGASVGSPEEPDGAWLTDCPGPATKAPGYAASEARRWFFVRLVGTPNRALCFLSRYFQISGYGALHLLEP